MYKQSSYVAIYFVNFLANRAEVGWGSSRAYFSRQEAFCEPCDVRRRRKYSEFSPINLRNVCAIGHSLKGARHAITEVYFECNRNLRHIDPKASTYPKCLVFRYSVKLEASRENHLQIEWHKGTATERPISFYSRINDRRFCNTAN